MAYTWNRIFWKAHLAKGNGQGELPIDWFPLCIVGDGRQARAVQELLVQQQLSRILKGTVLMPGEKYVENNGRLCPLLGTFDELDRIIEREGIQQVIIAYDNQYHETLLRLGDRCWQMGLSVYFASNLLRRVSKCALKREMDIPMLPFPSTRRGFVWKASKRVFDITFSILALISTSPLWLAIALAIKLSSPGPVFYRRKVIGKSGRIFDIYKFRSMVHKNSDKIHQEYMKELITNGLEREVYKIVEDPRVTSVGRVLRKLSLDELPQFLNVLRGEMSVVGPRQCTTDEFQYYEEWHKRRTDTKPGITGLWQVRGRSRVNYDEMVMLDLYYICHRSILLDLGIILETIPAMLNGKGAY